MANATAQQSAQSAYISTYQDVLIALAQDRELTELMRRGLIGGLEALDGNEQTRFHFLGYSEYMRAQNMFRQLLSNHFDPLLAQPLIAFFAQICKAKGGSEWWGSIKGNADPDFVAHIDSLLANPQLLQLQSAQPWYVRQ